MKTNRSPYSLYMRYLVLCAAALQKPVGYKTFCGHVDGNTAAHINKVRGL